MSQQQTIVAILKRGRGMLAKHLADFSDADLFVRPAPTANHVAYQLAHLLRTTVGMAKAVNRDASITLPSKVEGEGKAPPTSDDPAAFPSKAELINANESLFDVIIAGVETMGDADFDQPSPETFRGFAPTLGQLALMVPLHQSMHIGQIQVIRRLLGKPVLF